jgi:5-methylcytosine-specific restriction endonuclease McrA
MTTYIPAELRRQVRERAHYCCEYCLISEGFDFYTYEVDHIVAEKHRGTTSLENLCLSCFECNHFKGSDLGSVDVETDTVVPLFHPRRMRWEDHFRLEDGVIVPLSPEGRVTEFLLRFNNTERVDERQQLIQEGRYPCQ